MKFGYFLFVALVAFSSNAFAQANRRQILIVGSDHLSQIYKKEFPATDAFTPSSQAALQKFSDLLAQFRPDAVMVEELPEEQHYLDSLYARFRNGTLNTKELAGGRSEIFQIAFRVAKKQGLASVRAVNAPGGTSQGILSNGDSIRIYQEATAALRKYVGELYTKLQAGKMDLNQFLQQLNKPEAYNKVYQLRYITPARVTNGKFTNPDAMVDTAFINPRYIGAELISIFKNRDLKIYSNIVNTASALQAKRVLVVIGVAHIGSLRNIFRDDPEYQVVDLRH